MCAICMKVAYDLPDWRLLVLILSVWRFCELLCLSSCVENWGFGFAHELDRRMTQLQEFVDCLEFGWFSRRRRWVMQVFL